MEDLDKALEQENKRFWETYHAHHVNGAFVISMAIRWAAIVIAKEIREKGEK